MTLQVHVVVARFRCWSSLECLKVVIANLKTTTFVSLHILPLLACFESVFSHVEIGQFVTQTLPAHSP